MEYGLARAYLSPQEAQDALAAFLKHNKNATAAAAELGIPRSTLVHRVSKAHELGLPPTPQPPAAFEVEAVPDELPTADEILARRSEQFGRKKEAKEARHLIPVQVRLSGPIGLAFVGDPHLDDDGTDIDLIQNHVALFKKHDALLPLGIGDYSNNWVGRLARLYGQQTLSAAEAWVLVEWLVTSVPWVALVGGNHDAWSGEGDPIKWMAKSARVHYDSNGVRLALNLPSGRTVRVNARHDFRGNSMWNTAHGIAKAAQLGWRDHILTAGHTHASGINIVSDPMSGLISHCIRIGSYKTFDRYAEEQGLPRQTFTVCPVVVVRPQYPDNDNRFLQTFLEPETAADFLKFLRGRKSER